MVLTSPKSAHKSMKEQFESVSSYIVDYLWDQPAIYCGTYKKYNEGSLFGAWLDLRTFDSYEEFIDVCKQLHADEEDPEFMFQDYQCFPAEWYSESCMDKEVFDKIIAFIQMDDDKQKAFKAYVSATGDDSISDFEDNYEGEYDSEEDFATHIVNECYDLERMMGNLSYYFDYKGFVHLGLHLRGWLRLPQIKVEAGRGNRLAPAAHLFIVTKKYILRKGCLSFIFFIFAENFLLWL